MCFDRGEGKRWIGFFILIFVPVFLFLIVKLFVMTSKLTFQFDLCFF